MITLNGVKLAENDKELITGLFVKGGTASGFIKILKNQIKIYDLQKNLIGIINKHGMICKASKLDNGKHWYSLTNIDLLGTYNYKDKIRDIENLTISKKYLSDGEVVRTYK